MFIGAEIGSTSFAAATGSLNIVGWYRAFRDNCYRGCGPKLRRQCANLHPLSGTLKGRLFAALVGIEHKRFRLLTAQVTSQKFAR